MSVLPLAIAAVGAFVAWDNSPYAFGLGDNSFFHAMALWLGRGEVYIRDFVHFRTPGAYHFYEWLHRALGPSFRTTSFGILLETYVLQPACSFALAASATRVILGRVSILISLTCALSFFFLFPIFQLRTALPAAALAAYLLTLLPADDMLPGPRRWLLWLTGLLLGLSYWAGEETFLFAGYAIAAGELVHCGRVWRRWVARVLPVAIGLLLTVALPLLAMALQGLDLSSYFYYTIYYAFVVQPRGLNLPFPPLGSETLLTHYAPFFLLSIVAGIFAMRGKLDAAGVSLVSYACVRLITGLGRADTPHVAFAISELPVLLPIAITLLFERSGLFSRGLVAALGVLFTFVVGMFAWAAALLAIPPMLVALSRPTQLPSRTHSFTAAAGGLLILLWLQAPGSVDRLLSRFQVRVPATTFSYEGVVLTREARQELRAAKALVADRGISSLFAFPFIPEYYTLVEGHPTRITYFEGQVQPWELEQTIAELRAKPPDAVFQAFDYTVASSRQLYPVADYLSSAYSTRTVIDKGRSIEVRLQRANPSPLSRLADRLYASNPGSEAGTARLERLSWAQMPVPVITAIQPLRFDYPAGAARRFDLMLMSAGVASVEVFAGDTLLHAVEALPGHPLSVEIPGTEDSLRIVLNPSADGRPSRWLNPELAG